MDFDFAIVGAELLRAGLGEMPGRARRCTIQESTDFCRIPGSYRGRFKWPKLEQLHYKLFGEGLADAHDATADTLACMRCFFELKRLGLID